jgi:hypothetical protein
VLFLCPGVTNVLNFSQKLLATSENVRLVHVIELSGCALTCGVALAGFIGTLVSIGRAFREKGAITRGSIGTAAFFLVLFLGPGVMHLLNISQKVLDSSENIPLVRVMGLVGGAVLCGVCLVGLMIVLAVGPWKPRPSEDTKAAPEANAAPEKNRAGLING